MINDVNFRFRIYLLPLNSPETKKIVEGSPRCDIYTVPTPSDHKLTSEGFLKFIETAVNKIKKVINASKKPRVRTNNSLSYFVY